MKNNKTMIISVGVLIVLIVVVVYLFATRKPAGEQTPIDNGNSEFTSVSGDEKNSIIVNDQIPGKTIFFRNLTLEKNGFVVVRDNDKGKPGKVIGSLFLEAGADQSGNVELDTPTVEGGTYYIELYIDTNSNGMFDESEDTAVLTDLGSAVQVKIETTENLPDVKG